jgi:hypothetical protein
MIKTNQNALQERINKEVNRAYKICMENAEQGVGYAYFTTDKDIQRDVRDILESEHNIYVPNIYSRYSKTRPAVEHWGEITEMKLTWNN